MVSAEERYWRQVPKVNVLSTQRGIPQKTLVFRGLLALIVVVGAFLIMNQRSAQSDVDERISAKTSELLVLRTRLSGQRQQIDQLFAEINQLEEAREKSSEIFSLVSGAKIDWFAALNSVFEAETAGVFFESVSTDPGLSLLTVAGAATSAEARAALLPRFNQISQPLDFKNIIWQESVEGSIFTATFAVGR